MATISGKTKVWLSQYSSVTPQELEAGTVGVGRFCFSDPDTAPDHWTCVGDAEITITVADRKTILANKVEALKEEAKSIRAEAHKKCVEIEDKIQKLLAISYDAKEVA